MDLLDLEATRVEAFSSARDMLAGIVSDDTLGDQQFEICYATGQLLAMVPFRDAIQIT
jgi:hypothetical protein